MLARLVCLPTRRSNGLFKNRYHRLFFGIHVKLSKRAGAASKNSALNNSGFRLCAVGFDAVHTGGKGRNIGFECPNSLVELGE